MGAALAGLAMAALSATLPVSAKPVAATAPACAFADLSGVVVRACTGFFQGNLLQGDTGKTVSSQVATQLSALGMADATHATYLEKIASNSGSFAVDFSRPLVGDTVVGLHLGGGSDRFSANLPGGATAFYRFDAGANLDVLNLGTAMSASSGMAIFQTSAVALLPAPVPVPEPETWALMLAGLAAVASIAGRRR